MTYLPQLSARIVRTDFFSGTLFETSQTLFQTPYLRSFRHLSNTFQTPHLAPSEGGQGRAGEGRGAEFGGRRGEAAGRTGKEAEGKEGRGGSGGPVEGPQQDVRMIDSSLPPYLLPPTLPPPTLCSPPGKRGHAGGSEMRREGAA